MDETKPTDETFPEIPEEIPVIDPITEAAEGTTSQKAETTVEKPIEAERTPAEKALDFALGVGLLASESLNLVVERLNEAAKQMQDQAPDFIREMQEKGRPAREQLLKDYRAADLFTPLKTESAPKPASATVPNPDAPAEDEIRRLEDRVRELETQLSEPKPVEVPGEEQFDKGTGV